MAKEKGHSALPPSAASKWLVCGAWMRLNAVLPKEVSSAAADEGTLAHAHFEKAILKAYPRHVDTKDTDEILDLLRPAPDMEADLKLAMEWIAKQRGEVYPEINLDYGDQFGFIDHTGTADLVIVDRELLTIGDLKYGRTIVDVADNPQLLIYLSAAIQKFGKKPLYRLMVFQPRAWHRHGYIRDWYVTNEEMELFNVQLKKAIQANYRGGRPNPGPWCQEFCKAIAICPGPKEAAIKLFKRIPHDE
jgi:hypothetical protein